MTHRAPDLAAKLRKFLGEWFANGQLDDVYSKYGDDAHACSDIAKALVNMLSAAKNGG